ncbi:MAG: AAA family ATPase [Planctomycetota bacterium]
MHEKIILIGPIGAGKTTLSNLVARELNLPCVHMDDVRMRFYQEIGFDREEAKRLQSVEGFLGLYRYWKPFEVHAVERLVSEPGSAVLDFGGGHAVQEDGEHFSRVERALAPFANVILVLPSPSKEESIQILRERVGVVESGGVDFHEHFVCHHSNYDLAKQIVYTQNRSPQETCEEIVSIVRRSRL